MLEGPELVLAGLEAGHVDAVYFDAGRVESSPRSKRALAAARDAGVAVVALAQGVLDRVTDAVSPQPVVATALPPLSDLDAVAPGGLVLVLSGVSDPGNLGTAIRSADASGASAVAVCGDGVDVCNPKALRATAGSVFHLPVLSLGTTVEGIALLQATGRRVLGAVVRDAPSLWSTPLDGPCAVVIGPESGGLDPGDLDLLDGTVCIPMAGAAESLNAGVAASIVCFEALRQRSEGGGGPRRSPTI